MRLRPFPNSLAIVCVIAMAILVLVPILILGVPNGADLANHYRFALPFSESIDSGSWYPGWLAESNAGYGDPRFRFYPPGLYYVLALFRTIAGNWYAGSLVTFVLISIAGGVGLYLWTRQLTTQKVAMWAGILYALAPYRLNEIYQASLLSEYAACSVLPFAFAFTERICRKGRPADVAGLAASFALLILTNLPLTVIGTMSLVLYAGFRLERDSLLGTLTKLVVGFSLGLAGSAFFWSNVVAELPWIKSSSVDPNVYYNYRLNFVFSSAAITNRNTWFANVLALAVLGFAAPALMLLKKSARGSANGLKAVLVVMLVSFFMTTELSRPLWAIIPKLQEVQFPWRWLAITSMAGCILLAASIPAWSQQRMSDLRPRDLVPPLAFALALTFVVGHVISGSVYLNKQNFDSLLPEIRGAVSFKDWLPLAAHEVSQLNSIKDQVNASSRNVQINSWQPEFRQFQVSPGPVTEARVRTYFYPLWKASSDGKSLPVRAADDGALLVQVPADTTTVELTFQEPSRVRWTRLISAFAWIVILGLSAFGLTSARLARREWAPEAN